MGYFNLVESEYDLFMMGYVGCSVFIVFGLWSGDELN